LPSKAGDPRLQMNPLFSFQVSELLKVSLQVKMEPGRESELKPDFVPNAQEFDTGSRQILPPKAGGY